MSNYQQLRRFKPEELYLSENETLMILKFIFNPVDHELIDSLPMSDNLRGFAQGLLLEAIDASYSVGYVSAIFRSTANPTASAMGVIKKFGKKAAIHWLKNTSIHDLQNVEIYDFIRDQIAIGFRSDLRDFLAGINTEKQPGAFLAYKAPSKIPMKIWG